MNLLSGISFSTSQTIEPDSQLVERIEVKGDQVTVKLYTSTTLYHYNLTSDIKQAIQQIRRGESAGQIYNRVFKGKSIAKTIFE